MQSTNLRRQLFALLRVQRIIQKALQIITGDDSSLLKQVNVAIVNRAKPCQFLRLTERLLKLKQLINFVK